MAYRSLVTWIVFMVLGLGIIAHETTDIFQKQAAPKSGQLPMFSFSEKDIWRLEVIYQGRSAFFQRDDRGAWFLHDGNHTHTSTTFETDLKSETHHRADPGSSSEIEKQIEMTARMIADRKMSAEENRLDSRQNGRDMAKTTPERDTESNSCIKRNSGSGSMETENDCASLDTFGLETPKIIFSFYPRETKDPSSLKPLEILYAGDLLPSKYTYYTMKEGDSSIYLVPRYFITMLLTVAFGEDQVPSAMPEK